MAPGDVNPKTVRLSAGSHAGPSDGACVMELASMLAEEAFTDHPHCVCPAIAGFLRAYNDFIPDGARHELYPLAPAVIGSAAGDDVARERTQHVLAWAGARQTGRRARLIRRLQLWDVGLWPAARRAAALDPAERAPAIARLVDELLEIGPAATLAWAADDAAAAGPRLSCAPPGR
jgi:hypothetical protein